MKKFLLVIALCIFVVSNVLIATAATRKKVSKKSAYDFFNTYANGSAQQVRDKLKKGANPNATYDGDVIYDRVIGGDGWTPLIIAARYNEDPEVLSVLLEAGANVNATIRKGNLRGRTPLMCAVVNKSSNPQAVAILLKAGANVNARDNNLQTALMIAGWNRQKLDIISLLLEAGADVNAKDESDTTVLMHNVEFNENVEVIASLLKAGAKINVREKNGYTALMNAALHNHNPEVISLLLEAGADINVKSSWGKTALINAALANTPEVVSVLLKAGADVNAVDNHGETALMAGVTGSGQRIFEISALLLKAGADINIKNFEGKSICDFAHVRQNQDLMRLFKASESGNDEIDRVLADIRLIKKLSVAQYSEFVKIFQSASLSKLKSKLETISPNAFFRRDNVHEKIDDSLITLAAAMTSDPEIIKFLISKGANVNVRATGWRDTGSDTIYVKDMTALMKASICNHEGNIGRPDIVKALIDAGADVNAKDSGGMTALYWALDTSNYPGLSDSENEVIEILLNAGADAKNSLEYIFFSDKSTTPEILKRLLKAGADIDDDFLIMAAINTKYPEVIELLLDAGANPKVKSNKMKEFKDIRPIDLAKNNPNLKGTNALKRLDEESYESPEERSREEAQKKAAFNKILKSAENGNIEAQNKLGYMYWEGIDGVEEDGEKAVYWYKKAAAQNNTEAMESLGKIYRTGVKGLEKDDNEADFWFAKRNKTIQANQKNTFQANASIAGYKVNIRTKPTISSNVVKQLNAGHPVKTTKQTKAKDGMWYYIQTASGTQGWVFGKYVKFNR